MDGGIKDVHGAFPGAFSMTLPRSARQEQRKDLVVNQDAKRSQADERVVGQGNGLVSPLVRRPS